MELHVSTSSPSWPYLETASSKMEVEREFIFAWRTYPALWDPRHQYYTNKYKRLEYLKKLLDIYKKIKLNATTDDVRRKINIFRSNYKRELNKIEISRKSGQKNEYIYSPRVWYFPLLNFLVEPKPTIKWTEDSNDFKEFNSKVSIEHLPNKDDHAPATEESASENSSEDEKPIKEELFFSISEHLEEPTSDTHEILRKKRKSGNQNERQNCNSSLSESNSIEQTNPQALIWAEKLNRLSPLQKLYAEKAINDILFEAELGTLDRFSVQINSGTKSKSFI